MRETPGEFFGREIPRTEALRTARATLARAEAERKAAADPIVARYARRLWDLVLDTYSDNLRENKDGAIVYNSSWQRDMLEVFGRELEEFRKEVADADAT